MDGIARWQVDRYGSMLAKIVGQALKKGPVPAPPKRQRTTPGEPPLDGAQKQVFESLRSWRSERAQGREVDDSRVATTGTLRSIAREAPTTLEGLGRIPGMLPFRVTEFGEEILAIVACGSS